MPEKWFAWHRKGRNRQTLTIFLAFRAGQSKALLFRSSNGFPHCQSS